MRGNEPPIKYVLVLRIAVQYARLWNSYNNYYTYIFMKKTFLSSCNCEFFSGISNVLNTDPGFVVAGVFYYFVRTNDIIIMWQREYEKINRKTAHRERDFTKRR